MKKIISIFASAIFAVSTLIADEKDPFVGYYTGSIEGSVRYPINGTKVMCAEVFRGEDGYRIRFMPTILNRCEIFKTIENLKAEGGEISFNDLDSKDTSKNKFVLQGKVLPDSLDAKGKMDGRDVVIKLKRCDFVSPTMGNPAPKGAIVLFDGTNTSMWEQKDGSPCKWTLKNGLIFANKVEKDGKKVPAGSICTKDSFGPVRLHIEFRIPASYEEPLHHRGNSGLYFGDYEIQIIDSFGGEGDFSECGSIYRMTPPQVNASLEPEAWQTYDVEFHPAEFNGDKLVKFPTITVYHNGILVQNMQPIYWPTNLHHPENYTKLHSQKNYKVMLQDHGFPVAFRNIWLVNL